MTTTERLLEAAKEIWEQFPRHPFLVGIQKGTLDREKFRYYAIQGHLYLRDYAKSFAVGMAKAETQEVARLFLRHIDAINQELDGKSGQMEKVGVTKEELDATPRALDSISYTSFMLRIAYEEGAAEILAAVLPCGYSYEWIARQLISQDPDCVKRPFYGDWLERFVSEEYAAENADLLQAMNRLTEGYSEQQLRHLIEIFTLSSRYELAFWDLGWNMGG
ncbi:MAG: thiaminase II [Clostridia bacterium]|nr:thiaminase II [Clostridia bacterium]MBQ6001185.1 thiaminase II [Clostridia bacterium]